MLIRRLARPLLAAIFIKGGVDTLLNPEPRVQKATPLLEKAAPSLDGVGAVWEWTASAFSGYPGFKAHPYREYSEVFFGDRYRVLRGGSCATHPRVASPTFRNWDLPERRQLFAGVRIAR